MTAYVLLAALALAHLAPDVLASLTGIDAARWFYPLRGVLGVLLIVGLVWFPRPLDRRTLVVATWGVYEEALTAVCGGWDIRASAMPAPFTGLCDAHTGLPWYWLSLAAGALLTLWLTLSTNSEKSNL